MAFISERYVIVLCDFCNLACIHIESRFITWTKKDFEVGTEVWLFSFNLNSLEFSIEVLGLENWQKNVIKKHAQYQGELEDINQYVKSSNFSLVESNGA